jgi:hypothetical protein
MADDYMTGAYIFQHKRRDFTCLRAFFDFGCTILTGDMNVRTFETVGTRLNRSEHRRHDHLTVICIRD